MRALLADHEGYLWVGTELGLARFDAHRFIDYSEQLPELPRDVLFTLFEDSHGRIWTFWYKHNPRVLMPDRRTVLELSPAPDKPGDLTDFRPLVVEDAQGNVWFSGKQSLYRYSPDGALDAIPLTEPITGTAYTAAGPVRLGQRLLLGSHSGLYVAEDRGGEVHLRHQRLPDITRGNPPNYRSFVRLLEFADGLLLCSQYGVYRLDEAGMRTSALIEFDDRFLAACHKVDDSILLSVSASASAPVELVRVDPLTGMVRPTWPGLPATGVVQGEYVDTSGGNWLVVASDVFFRPPRSETFISAEVTATMHGNVPPITQTADGVLWIGTDGAGLAQFSRFASKFETITPGGDELAGSLQVRKMATDAADNVWVGTEDRGLLYWDRATDQWKQYLAGAGSPVRNVVVLKDGSVFASLDSLRKVMRYDPAEDRFVEFLSGIMHTIVLRPTDSGHQLIVSGSNRNEILRYEPATDQFTTIYDGSAIRKHLTRIRALTEDADGTIWFGTHGRGFGRIDGLGSATFWHRGNSALGSDEIFALRFDASGRLWIGTWHDALWRFDPQSGELLRFGAAEGQPLRTVFGILFDDEGALWLSGYRGLVRFEPCDVAPGCPGRATRFNHLDGLQAEEFDAEAWFQSPRGEMFFGGARGLNAFYPEAVRLNPVKPKLHITRLLRDGRALTSNTESIDHLDLPHDFGEIQVELSTLDYNAPSKNRYQYRDLDSGGVWNDLQEPGLVIHDWSDGRHRLQFRGTNNDGLWSDASETLAVHIDPPLYRQPAMVFLYAIVLLLLPSLYYRWRQGSLERQQKDLEEQVRQRTEALEQALSARERFFANISHEISAPLHMILLMLENNLDEDMPDRKGLYRSATGYAAQLTVYLRQLVNDARDRESDRRLYAVDPPELLRRLVEVNRPIAAARGVTIDLDPMPDGQVAMTASSAISVFSNLLCNALVYTPEDGRVRVAAQRLNGTYRVTIENSTDLAGKIDLDDMLERGTRGQFDPSRIGGHGLGLSIVTDALRELGGHLDRMMREDGYVVFHVDLPVARRDLPPLPEPDRLGFSHEQQLAIELVHSARLEERSDSREGGGLRVLIIEDDENVAHLLKLGLAKDHRVLTAGNCSEGVSLALSKLPDVIVCDLFLPDGSGFDAVKSIRANRMTQDAFVVMLTASISEEDRRTGISLGVDQFVSKPVSAETLRLMIGTHARLIRQRRDNQHDQRMRQESLRAGNGGATRFAEAWPQALESLYADPETSIKDFQTRLSLSYGALVRNCKQHFDSTPRRLLIERRIRAAQELLASGDAPIGLVAEMVGFSSHSQFTVAFKRETGQGPAEFRAERARAGRTRT